MRDAEQTIGNLIDKQGVSFISSVDENGWPCTKAMLPPRRRLGIETFYFTTNTSVSYTHLDVYKRQLCARLDIPMSSVLAIGDNQNDIEMLRFAGVSVAMGNAQEDVKSAARFVAGSNEEDGAAEFLERYFWG